MRRARAGVILGLWLAGCGGGGGGTPVTPPGPCELTPSGVGFLVYADGSAGTYDLRAVKQDGSCDQLVVATAGDDLNSAWSVAAGKLVWTGRRAGVNRIVSRPVAGGAEVELPTGPGSFTSPAVSPDGKTVVYEASGGGGSALVALSLAGGGPTTLVQSAGSDAAPAWAPDGQHLYFTSSRGGGNEVWRVRADGSTPEPVTDGSPPPAGTGNGNVVGRPAVSGDGRYLVYGVSSSTTSGTRLVKRVIATGAEADLSDALDSEVAISGDGARVAVRTQRFGGTNILLLDASGGVVKQVTSGGSAGAPAFPR